VASAVVPAVMPAADAFARAHPEIELAHYPVPYFEGFPDVPSPLEYRRHEGEAIRSWLARELRRDPPDVVIAGSETYAYHVPDLARAHDVPCVLMVHGGVSNGILAGVQALDGRARAPRRPRGDCARSSGAVHSAGQRPASRDTSGATRSSCRSERT
jgi:hypothetical protein